MVKSIELLEFLATRMQSIDKVLNVRMKMAGKRVEMHELLHAFKFANVDGVRDVTKAHPSQSTYRHSKEKNSPPILAPYRLSVSSMRRSWPSSWVYTSMPGAKMVHK